MRSVWDERAQASSQISLSPYRNVTAALFCRVPVCVFSGKTLVAFKPNSRSQSQLVFLQVCFYLVHFLILCARSGLGCTTTSQQIQAVKFQCERRQKSRWKTTRQMLQLPVLAASIRHTLSRPREKKTQSPGRWHHLSSAFSSFDFVLLCDQRNGGEDPKISKNKNRSDPETRWPSDHVALPMFVGRFIFTTKKS